MHVSYDDFKKIDLRIARIISINPIPGKTKIVQGLVDLGDGDQRTVIVGGAQYYAPEALVGKNVVVVTNLEPKKIAGVNSDAMLLAADVNDKPFWLTVHDDVPSGSKIL